MKVTGVEQRLNPETEVVVFRIVQESLSNVRRHSRATEARVNVDFFPTGVKAVVWDNY